MKILVNTTDGKHHEINSLHEAPKKVRGVTIRDLDLETAGLSDFIRRNPEIPIYILGKNADANRELVRSEKLLITAAKSLKG